MSKISDAVESAQSDMVAEIAEALRRFSQKTGLSVQCVSWSIARAYNSTGRTSAVEYTAFESRIGSGVC